MFSQAQTTARNREPKMKVQKLITVVRLARILAAEDVRLAAEYLRGQGLPVGLARHILLRRPA